MERYVNALEWNHCEASLELNGLWLGFCLLTALVDYLNKMFFDIFERHCLHESLDVDLLHLENIEDVSHRVKSSKITSADVLHVCNVVVDDLNKPSSRFLDILNHILQSLLVKGLRDS